MQVKSETKATGGAELGAKPALNFTVVTKDVTSPTVAAKDGEAAVDTVDIC